MIEIALKLSTLLFYSLRLSTRYSWIIFSFFSCNTVLCFSVFSLVADACVAYMKIMVDCMARKIYESFLFVEKRERDWEWKKNVILVKKSKKIFIFICHCVSSSKAIQENNVLHWKSHRSNNNNDKHNNCGIITLVLCIYNFYALTWFQCEFMMFGVFLPYI